MDPAPSAQSKTKSQLMRARLSCRKACFSVRGWGVQDATGVEATTHANMYGEFFISVIGTSIITSPRKILI